MRIRLIKIVLLILAFGTVSVISFSLGYKEPGKVTMDCVNSLLYNLAIDVDLLEHWQYKYNKDKYFEKKIKYLILNKILKLSEVNPSINNLKPAPIEGLYRLINYNNNHTFSFDENDIAFQIVRNYLKLIEEDVELKIKEGEEMINDLKIKSDFE